MLGNTDGFFDPDNIKVLGLKVAIRKDQTNETIYHGGIVLPESSVDGYKATKATVVAVGKDANEDYGIAVGDVIRFDQCGVMYDTNPVTVIEADNIIIKMHGDKPFPLKNRVLVKKKTSLAELENTEILLPEDHLSVAIGEVFEVDNEDVVRKSTLVFLTCDADELHGPDGSYFSYEQDNIIATLEM